MISSVRYVTTWKGRRRYIPAISSSEKREQKQAERQAVNTVLQGSAAELMKLAMLRVHQQLESQYNGRASIVMQLHDEMLVEAPSEHHDQVVQILRDGMENAATFSVRLPVKSKSGVSWGLLQSHKQPL